MSVDDELRRRARATWAAGDWDSFAELVEPCGARGSWGRTSRRSCSSTRAAGREDGSARIHSDYLVLTAER